jgi:2-keto-4-pentenoate hydratase/2-oxohepta-3-ene-1,7-dioic acid hydratase in catechol pathway
MKSLIEVGDSAVAAVKTVYRAAQNLKTSGRFVEPGGERRVFHPYTAVRLRAPIPNPSKVFGMASNYIEEGSEPAKVPSYFLKSVSAIIGPGEPIVRTSLLEDGGRNTHEPEFAIVIGRRAKNVSEADAMNYVLGCRAEPSASRSGCRQRLSSIRLSCARSRSVRGLPPNCRDHAVTRCSGANCSRIR